MKLFCDGCNKIHDDYAWRTRFEGQALVHICTLYFKPAPAPEIVPQQIKDDRKTHAKSLIQPWRGGYPSAEFMQAYPKQAKKMFTDRERRQAKAVWKDVLPHGWEKTK